MMSKLEFIDWFLDLEECFNFWKICDEKRVQRAFNMLNDEEEELW